VLFRSHESQAALLTSEAAFLSGTGVLTLAFPKSLELSYRDFIPPEMLLPLPETPSKSLSIKAAETIQDFISSNDVTVIGPGLSKNSETIHLIWEIISHSQKKLIIASEAKDSLIQGVRLIIQKEGIDKVNEYLKGGEKLIIFEEKDLEIFKKGDQKESLLNASQILNSSIILLTEEPLLIFKDATVKTFISYRPEDKRELIPALAGMLGSFNAQNFEKQFEASATALFLALKTAELRREEGNKKSIVNYLKRAIKEEEN